MAATCESTMLQMFAVWPCDLPIKAEWLNFSCKWSLVTDQRCSRNDLHFCEIIHEQVKFLPLPRRHQLNSSYNTFQRMFRCRTCKAIWKIRFYFDSYLYYFFHWIIYNIIRWLRINSCGLWKPYIYFSKGLFCLEGAKTWSELPLKFIMIGFSND